MARHGLFKGDPRLRVAHQEKTCTFTDLIEDNVIFFNWGCTLKKQWNVTDQIEDNQLNIWFQHQGTWFFLWY